MAESRVSKLRSGRSAAEPKAPASAPAPVPTPETAPAPPPAPAAPPVAPPPPEAPGPASPKGSRALQILTETITILSFLGLALVPLGRFGVVPVGPEEQILVLTVASLALTGAVLLFGSAKYTAKRRTMDEQLLRKYRRDMILTSLTVGGTFVVAIMFLLEIAALLAFLGFISRQSEASVTFADNYVLFATFTLLFCSMLLIVRTSFETRYPSKSWHKGVAVALLAAAAVLAAITLLVNYAVLTRGPFAGVEPRQSVYIITLGALFQIFAFKLLLRYPAITQIVYKEIESARKANKDLRDVIQRRALRAYIAGLLFVLLSMFLLGGVATQRLPVRSDRTLDFILLLYLVLGLIVMGLLVTRYLQHKYIASRARRKESGEVIAKKRLSREQLNRRVVFSVSIFFGSVFALIGLATLIGRNPLLEAKFGTDFLILAFLVGVGPYGWYRGRDMKRIRAMDDKFPDFLRDLAESERAGMTLPRALKSASKGVYGALTPEIKRMNAQVEWGVSFTDSLSRFSQRVRTPLIERTVALIIEASKAGGNVIDILTAASDDAREIKQIIEERRRSMGIYGIIIYISFFVFLVVVYILADQFLPAFANAVTESTGAPVAGLSIRRFSVDAFVTVFFHAAIVQGIGGGLVSGIMQEGHPLSGLKHAIIMTILSWVFFRVLVG